MNPSAPALLRLSLSVQEQQKETARLRARVAQAAIERGTLVAEMKACDSSLHAQTVGVPCVASLGWFVQFNGVTMVSCGDGRFVASVNVTVS